MERPFPLLLIVLLGSMLIGAAFASAQMVTIQPSSSEPEQEDFELEVHLDPEGRAVMGMEISVRFDANIVRLEEITPGAWFTQPPAADYFFWDYTHAGTELIRFSASSLGAALSTVGTIAVCRFTAVQPGICPLDFLGVDLRDGENAKLSADHSSGDRIVIDGAIATGTNTLDAVKALYR